MFKVLKKEGLARRGRMETVHGTIETPVFMNVGTSAAIKGAVGKTLESIKLFDVYKGKQVEEGKKSVSYSIVMRSHEGTLTDEQADAIKMALTCRLSIIAGAAGTGKTAILKDLISSYKKEKVFRIGLNT